MSKRGLFILCLLSVSLFAKAGIFDALYLKNQAAIDSIRKGDFTLVFLDKENQPVTVDVTYSLVNHEFPWGTALAFHGNSDDDWYKGVARKYFNHGVTENAFKWSVMQPYNGPVRYNAVNSYLDWCDEAGWEMRGHTLLWGSKSYSDFHPLQKWVKDLPEEDIDDTCKVRVQREMTYYKGRIKEYDVMNEAIPYHADYLQRTIGDSINWNCFKWAREADPDAKLYINDYNVITGANDHFKYMALIQEILDNGGPIDGIGVQSHFGGSVNTSTMRSVLDTLASFGLPIKITEFDMDVDANGVSELKQANDYAWAMRTAFAHPAVEGFLFWGFWDSRHWRGGSGFFNENKTPKIAADSVYSLIHEIWHTQGQEVDCDNLDVNAYYGTYEVSVNYNDTTLVHLVDMSKTSDGDTLYVHLEEGTFPVPQLLDGVIVSSKSIKLRFDQSLFLTDVSDASFALQGASRYSVADVSLDDTDSKVLILTTYSPIDTDERVFVNYDPSESTILGDNDEAVPYIAQYELNNSIPASLHHLQSDFNIEIVVANGFLHIDNDSELDAFEIISMSGKMIMTGSMSTYGRTSASVNHLKQGIYILKVKNNQSNIFVTEKVIIKN